MRAMIARRREKCIHCHDVKVAELRHQQDLGEFERSMIFTYPMPSAVGIDVDPDDQTMVRSVQPGSPAAKAGVRSGDEIASLGGREVLSAGDMTRVLELLPQQADLPIELHRDGRSIRASLHLSGAWKRTADPSWRASVGLAGPNPGFWAKELNAAEKRAAGLPADALALKLTFLFPQHPTPIGAGLRLGDILVSIDGLRRAMTTRQLHAHCQMQHDYGDTVPVVILRDGREIELTLKLPEKPMRVD
ncbi:MAG: PDZ domain-containing protein [Isosphaeraceae bacterium]|nr:PDZ domain-containing protein [Isosphaeraceae bacterium]